MIFFWGAQGRRERDGIHHPPVLAPSPANEDGGGVGGGTGGRFSDAHKMAGRTQSGFITLHGRELNLNWI